MATDRKGHELVVDRLEGEFAVLELDGARTIDLPRWMLPPDLREGDVVRAQVSAIAGECRVEFRVDRDETRRRHDAARGFVERLRARDPGGDIEL